MVLIFAVSDRETFDCINYWFLNDRSLIVFVIENLDLENLNHDKKKTILEFFTSHYGHLKKAMILTVFRSFSRN